MIAITAAAGISNVVGFAFSAVGQPLLAPLMRDLIEVAQKFHMSSRSLPNKRHAEVVGYAQDWGRG